MLLASSTGASKGTPNFLIPNGTFFAELILFAIILGIVATVVLPPIRRTLAERDRVVRGSLKAGEEGRAEAERLSEERDSIMAGARLEARARFEEAARKGEELRIEARARADRERARIVAEATEVIESERSLVRAEVMGEVRQLVVAATSRVVGRPVDPSRHAPLLAEVDRQAAANGSVLADGSGLEGPAGASRGAPR